MAQELEAYLAALQSTVRQQEADVDALQSSVDEVARVKQLVTALPEKVRHKAMVPYGKHAFFEGELIHTNELMVGLGCGLALEASASQAAALLGRRQARGEAALARAAAQLAELRAKTAELQLGLANEEGEEFMEIRQDYEEAEELLAAAAAAGTRLPPPAELGAEAVADGRRGGEQREKGKEDGEDEEEEKRIFARLAELERLEAEAGSGEEEEAAGATGSDREVSGPGGQGDGARASAAPAAEGAGRSDSAAKAGPSAAGSHESLTGDAAAGASPAGAASTSAAAAAQGTTTRGASPKQKSTPALKKGFLLGGSAGGSACAGAKKGKPSVVAPAAGEATADRAGPSSSGSSSSHRPVASTAAGRGTEGNGILRSPSVSGEVGAGVSPGGVDGSDAAGPRRRRVSFADGSIPGQAEDSPGPHEHRSPSPPALSNRSGGAAGAGLRPALKQAIVSYQAEVERGPSRSYVELPGKAAGGPGAKVFGRIAGMEEEGGDAAMAMARAREAAFTGMVRERMVEEATGVCQVPAIAASQGAVEQAAPKRVSKFKQQRMGSM